MQACELSLRAPQWRRALASLLLATAALGAGGCATLPPVLDGAKAPSSALANPTVTTLGREFAAREKQHPDQSGFHLLTGGQGSFALHLEVAARAERTLDAQYFLVRQDDTGKLMLEALLEAADRGVHVRLLIDDAEAFDAGSTIRPLAAHPNIEIRIFNPWVVRRELSFLRWAEFLVGSARLNYRMHNKLFVGDNAIAVTGGRNIGDPYFQASDAHNLGDFDLAVVGPMVRALSRSFDRYWNDKLAVPVESLPLGKPSAGDLEKCREILAAHKAKMADSEYVRSLPNRDLIASMLSGRLSLTWASAQLAYDPPEKGQVERDERPGTLIWERVGKLIEGAQQELIVISPYLVPGDSEMAVLERLRQRGVRIRMVTNSLASTDMPIAHAGYVRYRLPLLEAGCELYEVRAQPGAPEAHGMIRSGESGAFGLHAKSFVVDRKRVFVGSMNFDQRSLGVNTEIGIIIDSPSLAEDVARRFDALVQPANSYHVSLAPGGGLQWTTEEAGKALRLDREPAVDAARVALIDALSVLPIDSLL
jgi:putative cardiolipin synthase